LKSVWESHVTWGTPVQSFVFLGLLVFELEPMYAVRDIRQTDDGRRSPLIAPPPTGRGHNKVSYVIDVTMKSAVQRNPSPELYIHYSC